jgi:hypothetical protein
LAAELLQGFGSDERIFRFFDSVRADEPHDFLVLASDQKFLRVG